MLVSFIDHGATPPSTLAARNTATTGAPLRACVAAGVLGFGRYHGGDIESCMQFLDTGLALVREGASLREAAVQIVRRSLDAGETPPGFGHRFHTRDPRAARLFQMALELEVESDHISMIRAVELVLHDFPDAEGRIHPVNIDVSDPEWKEAFLMPREAHGTVVQLAESHGHPNGRAEMLAHVAENGPNEHPRWWVDPLPAEGPPARLRRVVLRTPSLTSALSFFAGVLQGDVEHESGERVELVWPRGARIALEEHPEATPGVDRLEVEGLANETVVVGTRFVPL